MTTNSAGIWPGIELGDVDLSDMGFWAGPREIICDKALTDHPDQLELLYGDYDAHSRTAMEEIVRWATPVIHFRRTATEDTDINGIKRLECSRD
jgi:hypothetical protein